MFPPIAGLFSQLLYKPVLGPVIRWVSGLVAIPIFRFFLRRVLRLQTTDAELERDLEHWFRGAILLLAATANLEEFLFGAVPWKDWLTMLLRMILAIGVIESMPDQDLFGLVHRGPPKLRIHAGVLKEAWSKRGAILKGLLVLHLKRSSPVFVIMCVIFGGAAGTTDWKVGWWCYALALFQYLIVALATDRSRAGALLAAIHADDMPENANLTRVSDAAGAGGVYYDQEDALPPMEQQVYSRPHE